jgi:hypothetical protein
MNTISDSIIDVEHQRHYSCQPLSTSAVRINLIKLYEAWNKPEKAKEWRAKLAKKEAVEE